MYLSEIDIRLEYQPHVPKTILEEFKRDLRKEIILTNTNDLEHWEYDHGRFVADVTLFIAALPAGLLVGVLGNLITDTLKSLYRGLVKSFKGRKSNNESPSLEINIESKEFRAKFVLKDTISEEATEKCFNGFKEIVQGEKLKTDLKNQDYYQRPARVPSIEYKFNVDKNLWLPVDFEEIRRSIKKSHDEINDWRD